MSYTTHYSFVLFVIQQYSKTQVELRTCLLQAVTWRCWCQGALGATAPSSLPWMLSLRWRSCRRRPAACSKGLLQVRASGKGEESYFNHIFMAFFFLWCNLVLTLFLWMQICFVHFCVSLQMQNINLCIIIADKSYWIRLIRLLNYIHVDILHTILYTG